jgi:WD40 repeat protein
MLRWFTVFGAVALVAIGVVFYIYGGPPPVAFSGHDSSVEKANPAAPDDKIALGAEPGAEPAPAGPWSRVVAVQPRVVIHNARLTALHTLQVPALRDGQIAFLGTEVAVKEGEEGPPGSFKQVISYLVTEAQNGDEKKDDWVVLNGKWYRPVAKGEDVKPNKVRLYRATKWFLPVDEGTIVKEGQLLAVIDPVTAVDDLAIKVSKFDAAEADRAAEEKQRDEYRERQQRAYDLYKKGAQAYEDFSAAKLAYEYHVYETVHKTEDLKVAGNEMRQAETLLDLHLIRSKINGQVKQVLRHKGEAVKSLEPVLEMIDYSKLRIKGRVDLQDVANLPDPRNPQDKREVHVEATSLVPPQTVLTGHFDAVTGVAVSQDGQIVSVSEDKSVHIWDKDYTKRLERLVVKQPAGIRAVACTGKGAKQNLCLTGAADGVARLYDLSSKGNGAVVRQFTHGHKAAINCVAFSPHGEWAVTGGEDRAICLWDVERGELLNQKPFPEEWGHKNGVTSVAFLSVGPENEKKLSVVSAGRDGALIVWPLTADGAPEKAMRFDRRFGEVQTLGVNPDGRQLLFDQGKDLRVISAENGSLLGSLSASAGTSFSKLALFSPNGHLILTSTGAGRLQLWRAPTEKTRGHELEQLVWTASRDEQATTNCGAFDPNEKFLVTGTQNRNVIVWPMPEKEVTERRLMAKVISLTPEVSSGTVGVTAELDNPGLRLLPGDSVTLVVYPQ